MNIKTEDVFERKEEQYLQELYRIYEFADGLCFPEMKFRCGNIENYVKTGILSESDAEELWNGNAMRK